MDAQNFMPSQLPGAKRQALGPSLPEVSDLEHFAPLLNRQLGFCRRGGHRLALLLIEVDAESGVAAELSESGRHQLMQAVGARLRARVRESDMVCRIGDRRFGVVLMDAGRIEADVVRTRLHKQLWGPYSIDERRFFLTLQMGMAVHRECGMTGVELTESAARALGLSFTRVSAAPPVPQDGPQLSVVGASAPAAAPAPSAG